jgi:predicted DNA-binding transcriptional regulator YafY
MDLNFRRLVDTLSAVPGHRKASTSEILERLKARGYSVTARTLQRDLEALAQEFGIERDDRAKPYGWHWPKKVRRISLPEMDWPEALSLSLLRRYMDGLLPASVQDHLSPYFAEAEKKLQQKFPDVPLRRWPEKIQVVSPGQPMNSPKVSRAVRDVVTEALLADRQVEIRYRRRNDAKPQQWRIHPLGLIQSGRVFYLAARVFDYEDCRMLALHRVERAVLLESPVEAPKGFSLEGWSAQALGFGGSGRIKLVADFHEGSGKHLIESPLSEDQVVSSLDKDGTSLRISATVADTKQLQWWLLGFADSVEVKGPKELREKIAKRLQAGVKRYNGERES